MVLATAYDAVDENLRRRLLRQSPHNVLRLELPVPPEGGEGHPYQAPSRVLREWKDRGVFEIDPSPCY